MACRCPADIPSPGAPSAAAIVLDGKTVTATMTLAGGRPPSEHLALTALHAWLVGREQALPKHWAARWIPARWSGANTWWQSASADGRVERPQRRQPELRGGYPGRARERQSSRIPRELLPFGATKRFKESVRSTTPPWAGPHEHPGVAAAVIVWQALRAADKARADWRQAILVKPDCS